MYKHYTHQIPFTKRTEWLWPKNDKKLLQVFDHVNDINVFMRYVKNTRLCIQAGGACGVWPYRFAQSFSQVLTFEPNKQNFHCLTENISDLDNVVAINGPLSDDGKKYSIKNEEFERENAGAGYAVEDANGLEAYKIDDFKLPYCDLIQLDIEGFELKALQGAKETIQKYKPVIVLEEKLLPHMIDDPAAARNWLETTFGYEMKTTVHRDVVLVCG